MTLLRFGEILPSPPTFVIGGRLRPEPELFRLLDALLLVELLAHLLTLEDVRLYQVFAPLQREVSSENNEIDASL